ncbi:S-layer homology domain-containing protein [Proteiniborus sp.]|uniref:S-layer homology domain-containing protein n=1 Tax=Proteiniborus sp. TaxID=2079015 RepID=UPI00332237B6
MRKETKLFSTISLLIAFLMMFSVISFADSTEGVKETEQPQFNEWVHKGWSRLYENDTFNPDKALSRVEFVALINSLFNFKETAAINFTDIPEQANYYKEVAKAFKAEYVVGKGNDVFSPDAEITKAEAYMMLARALKLNVQQEADKLLQFNDSKEVPKWAIGAVEALSQKGWINDKNKVKPLDKVLGSEAVVLLEKAVASKPEEATKDAEESITSEEPSKGNGKSPLSFKGAYFTSIVDNKSVDLAKLDEGLKNNENIIIKLEFDRGIVRDNWENNQKQILLKDNDDQEVLNEVFRINGVDNEKSYIFIKPLTALEAGKNYKIIMSKDLKANNGSSLGEEIVVTFSVQ